MAYTVPETHQPCKGGRSELPLGLRELDKLTEVVLSRNVNACEVVLCCTPRQASFSLLSPVDDTEILHIRESGLCVFRECLGAARSVILRANNAEDETVAHFQRNMTCSRGCCGCRDSMEPFIAVNSPPYIRLGVVRERPTCCVPTFDAVTNKDGEAFLIYRTKCCYLKTCNYFSNVEIEVHDPKSDEMVAKILKYSKSDCMEFCSFKNDFTIQFLSDLDIVKKLYVIGICLLVDFNNFEHDRRYCC